MGFPGFGAEIEFKAAGERAAVGASLKILHRNPVAIARKTEGERVKREVLSFEMRLLNLHRDFFSQLIYISNPAKFPIALSTMHGLGVFQWNWFVN